MRLMMTQTQQVRGNEGAMGTRSGIFILLTNSISAIETWDHTTRTVTVPGGSSVTVRRNPQSQNSRMADISWEGRNLAISCMDLFRLLHPAKSRREGKGPSGRQLTTGVTRSM
jgi:hypothetical protein